MSNVNFSFGTNLLGNFVAGNGVYVYATVFAGGTWVRTFELVDNGTVSGSLTNLPLPASLVSGPRSAEPGPRGGAAERCERSSPPAPAWAFGLADHRKSPLFG